MIRAGWTTIEATETTAVTRAHILDACDILDAQEEAEEASRAALEKKTSRKRT